MNFQLSRVTHSHLVDQAVAGGLSLGLFPAILNQDKDWYQILLELSEFIKAQKTEGSGSGFFKPGSETLHNRYRFLIRMKTT